MEVKKLMENLVLCGLSLDISPSNAGAKNLHMNNTINSEQHVHKHTYVNATGPAKVDQVRHKTYIAIKEYTP